MLQLLHRNTAIRALRHLADTMPNASAYCRARMRLPLEALRTLLGKAADAINKANGGASDAAGVWHGHRTLLLDGSSTIAPDTPATSKCYGSCAVYWPPVTGTAAAGQGLPGRVGTIRRTGGSHQLTYNGHPLYTYIGDSAPGQARGNNLNLNGGLWHEVPASR